MELVPALTWERTAEPEESWPNSHIPSHSAHEPAPSQLIQKVNPLWKETGSSVLVAEPLGALVMHRHSHNIQVRPEALQLSSSYPFLGGNCPRGCTLSTGSPDTSREENALKSHYSRSISGATCSCSKDSRGRNKVIFQSCIPQVMDRLNSRGCSPWSSLKYPTFGETEAGSKAPAIQAGFEAAIPGLSQPGRCLCR